MFILTANQNQAFQLKQSKTYHDAQIMAWQAWVPKLFEQINQDQRLLKPIELDYIWQICIRQIDPNTTTSIESLSQIVREAWWLTKNWQIPWKRLAQSYSLNTQWFCKAANAFNAYCKKHHCIDESSALTLLIKTSLNSIPQNLVLHGFFSLTPLQELFLKTIAPDFRKDNNNKNKFNATLTFHVFEDFDEELEAALAWAIDEHQKNPTKKIAVIVPELEKYRGIIESHFCALLSKTSGSYNISIPPKLTNHSLIQTALTLLSQHISPQFNIDTLAQLMRSPYWGKMPEEKLDRAAFMLKLRELKIEQLNLETLLNIAEPWPKFQALIHLLYQKPEKKPQPLITWIEYWQNLLQSLGFPHQLELWQSLLNELVQCFSWHSNFSPYESLALLKNIARKTYWEKNPLLHAPIQILGVVDAIHQVLDQAWFVDATTGKIPFKMSINPLLDQKLQREYGIWALDTSLQTQWANEIFENLKSTCQHLTVSYGKEKEGQIKIPATFLTLPTKMGPVAAAPRRAHKLRAPRSPPSRHPFLIPEATLLIPWQEKYIPGASSAVKSQRLCSMQAFAKFRLKIEEMPQPVLGLTPIERGIITHRALHLIWQSLQTQKNLLSLSAEALANLIDKIIPIALKCVPWLRRKLLPKALLHLESQTLKNNLTEWLTLEATRPPFKIFALEQASQVLFKNYKWRLRVDRIDELEDGHLLLIDYKTGSVSTKNWYPDIFTEPQLPLYAVTSTVKFSGIVFAEVISNNLSMKGIAKENFSLGKLGFLKSVGNWDALFDQWHQTLEGLVENFVQTQVTLNPIEGNTTCKRCGLQSFCRVFEI